jgi:hypothetical protein
LGAAAKSPVRTVADVLARLEEIDAALPTDDGVKWFNRLYLEMTQQVGADPPQHEAAPGFLAALDVVFARRYFAAYEAAGAGPKPPAFYPFHAWKPLFESRFATDVAPVQFALAGMNAHINHDLSIALVDLCEERGVKPTDDSPEHQDYEAINGMIARVEKQMKAWMMTGLLKDLDQTFDHLDHVGDVVAVWDIEAARDAAWVRAEVLWKLRDLSPLRQGYEEMNDRATGFAGRALLTPVG